MKKRLWVVGLLGLIVALAGCGAAGAEPEQVIQATPLPTTTLPPLLPPIAVTAGGELTDKDVQRITLADAKKLLDSGEALLVDARSAAAYASKHAAGAISLPEVEVVERVREMPADKALIFYCT